MRPSNLLTRGLITASPGAGAGIERAIADAQRPERQRGLSEVARSPLVDLFPTYSVERAYFGAISRPAGLSIAAGQSAWYLLRRISPYANVAQDVSVVGLAMSLRASNYNGASGYGISAYGAGSAGTSLAWGDVSGTRAAIVVGLSLPLDDGVWTSAAAYIPGIESGVEIARTSPMNMPAYLAVQNFPPGAWEASNGANMILPRFSAGAFVARVPFGTTIDVALVIDRTSAIADNATQHYIVGNADVSVYLGLTQTKTAFSQ